MRDWPELQLFLPLNLSNDSNIHWSMDRRNRLEHGEDEISVSHINKEKIMEKCGERVICMKAIPFPIHKFPLVDFEQFFG